MEKVDENRGGETVEYKMDDEIILEVDHLKKYYGLISRKTVLSDISFKIPKGKCVSIIGKNGEGKSTIIKIVCGIIPMSSGKIHIKGRFSYVPEVSTSFKNLSAIDNLKYYHDVSETGTELSYFLNKFNLNDSKTPLKGFSKGMKRKVDLVRGIAADSDLLIMDEPFDGLDPAMSMELIEIIKEQTGKGISVLLTSHDMSYIEKISDYVYFLSKGQLKKIEGWNKGLVITIQGDTDKTGSLFDNALIMERKEGIVKLKCDKSNINDVMKIIIANNFKIMEQEFSNLESIFLQEVKNE